MLYLKLAIEAAVVLILIGFIALQLPASAALAAMGCFVWFIWLLARLLGRSTAPRAHTDSSDALSQSRKAVTL
jgi:hypothetical protein